MKKTLFALALAALATTPALKADENAKTAPAAKPAAATTSTQPATAGKIVDVAPAAPLPPLTKAQRGRALEHFGWFISQGIQSYNLENFGFSAADLDALLKGLRAGAEGKDYAKTFQSVAEDLTRLLREAEEAARPKVEAKQKARLTEWIQTNQDFLRQVDKEPGVHQTASRLRYKITAPGTGPKPRATSMVKAKYTGKLVDGTVFDSTARANNEPATFTLDKVIPGWTEGLQLIGKGGKITLYIPSELGYREQGGGSSIPPHSTLIFDVELVEIVADAPVPVPAATPATPATK
ncbi:MAG: FKBP-type peptidyl-prolyl cis-trans isomerase [Puniceicoccales bacterium]|nr:FKBP-type peptidyl-prolyl cis-trans isomerase [Puniceicoccales bacterium]